MICLHAAAFAGPELAVAARTRPAGAAVFAAWYGTAADGKSARTELGGAFDVYFLWYEADLRARETLLGGFLVASASAGVEPGFFVRDDDRDGPRAFALRPLGRAQLELNVRDGHLWVYGRSNVLARNHPFAEWDPFRYRTFDGPELTHENALAVMASPTSSPTRKPWFYVEGIAVDSWGLGAIDRNVRAGLIVEKLTPTISLDVDGYWSFMDNGLGGPGVFGIVFFVPPPRA